MATRTTHEKARTETPRLDDLPSPEKVPTADPLVGRTSKGTFAPGNTAGKSRGAKTVLKQPLGGLDADPDLKRDAELLYNAIIRDLPQENAEIRAMVAAQCRNAVFATRYAEQATIAGITSKDGMKWTELSRSHDLAAQKLAVTAYDMATREAIRNPRKEGDPFAMTAALADLEQLVDFGPSRTDAGKPRTPVTTIQPHVPDPNEFRPYLDD